MLKKSSLESQKNHEDLLRIVIGSGALGLFIAYRTLVEFPNTNLYVLTKTIPEKDIYIETPNNGLKKFNFNNFFFIDNEKTNCPPVKNKNIFFYICLPPEQIIHLPNYLNLVLKSCNIACNYSVIILNNGIINYKEFINSLYLKNCLIIRCIVISGFMRTFTEKNIIIKNTSGNIIYYGYYNKLNTKKKHLFPRKYLNWIYNDNIFKLEKAKFITNFILGLIIGNKLLKNSEILTILNSDQLDAIFTNYCLIFSDNQISKKYLHFYFNKTIASTSENINSISYAWYHGNKKPFEYFLAKIKELSYLSGNIKVQDFFSKLINLNIK